MTVPAGEQPYLEAILAVPHPVTKKDIKTSIKGDNRESSLDARIALMRSKTVMSAHNAIRLGNEGQGEAAQQAMKDLDAEMQQLCEESGEPVNLKALKIDVSTRMQKALDGFDRFQRWGEHYLRAINRSHQLQQCNNHLDAGAQYYGGDCFHEFKEAGDKIFLGLAMPPPSR